LVYVFSSGGLVWVEADAGKATAGFKSQVRCPRRQLLVLRLSFARLAGVNGHNRCIVRTGV
jgi:hypothetical protein